MNLGSLLLALWACDATGDEDSVEPVEYMTVHGFIKDRDEDCYTYKYFKANVKHWGNWTLQFSDSEVFAAQGKDLRCYFFPSGVPASTDPFFFNDPEPGFFGSTCSVRRFWYDDVCEGQIPYDSEAWNEWPNTLPDGVVPVR